MTIPPIRKSVTVPLSPEAAFRLFTEGMGGWWPGGTHSVSAGMGGKPHAITVTPGKGGHITEETPDGRKARWATVTAFQPGARFAFQWHVGQDEDEVEPTEVEVTFTPVDQGTRVDLVHDGFARRGKTAAVARGAYGEAWGFVLGRFVAAGRVGAVGVMAGYVQA
jgi:hypothetical protein